MTTADYQSRTEDRAAAPSTRVESAFASFVGLAAVAMLVQGLLAGIFIQDPQGRDKYQSYINAHGAVADVAIALSLVAAVLAVTSLRHRRDLAIGAVALLVLTAIETLLGHLINGSIGGSDHDALTAIHVPLAMALIALAGWLSLRVGRRRA